MNLDDYKNKVPYLTKNDFIVVYYYKAGEVVGKFAAKEAPHLDDCVKEKVFDEVAYKAAEKKYSKENRRLAELFIVDLFHDNGLPDDEFTRALYNIAYQQGHSAGYSEIKNYFEEMSHLQTLAKKVYGK